MKLMPGSDARDVVDVALESAEDIKPPSKLMVHFIARLHDKRLHNVIRTGEFSNLLRQELLSNQADSGSAGSSLDSKAC
jgi:hypothetical protein